jgi:outer membrane protein OmpU
MKHVLLATTALAMTASLAAAEVSLSGRAGAGVLSNGTDSEIWSGMDIAISASVTTDGGMTLSVGDDIGGGKIADYADKELDSQAGDIGTPGVTVSMGGTTVSFDNQAIDDLYDDDQNGDIGISSSIGGVSIGLTFDTDPAVHGGTGANAAIMNAGTSYSASGAMGAISVGVVGTDRNDAGLSAYKVSASMGFGDATVSASADMVDGADSVTEFGIAYTMGDVSASYSADNQEDWDASVSYSAGNMTVSYATDEEDAYEIDASVSMGGGVSVNASTDSNDTMILGVGFTF